jgi:hypothetical protein
MPRRKKPTLSKEIQDFAMYVAMVIRNAMEDFHCEHLSDEQMRQLNPIIRDAVATAVHAFEHPRVEAAQQFVQFHLLCIPGYWERPKLLDDYVQMWNAGRSQTDHDQSGNEPG